eukprot:CAMPEP_0119063876 /NCGR_PEP_ID=MMETSP1178-20130426/7099_1 /TAXON_ID=33656 /ORGANISM="unid sp, Strain CCMP2000" /LENGTH=349 /DNA_ID=CAMNT_0007045265 /DNA_START=48 /DNA_END=1097 /DNA_ORIENTATION=-
MASGSASSLPGWTDSRTTAALAAALGPAPPRAYPEARQGSRSNQSTPIGRSRPQDKPAPRAAGPVITEEPGKLPCPVGHPRQGPCAPISASWLEVSKLAARDVLAAADHGGRAFASLVLWPVEQMIELVGKCGDRFDRLALGTQWVTCVFLVAVLLLSGGGFLIRRGQNIGAAERAQRAALDAEAAAWSREQERARHDLETTKAVLPYLSLPDGKGSSRAGVFFGHGHSVDIHVNASVPVDSTSDIAPPPTTPSRSYCCPELLCSVGWRRFTSEELHMSRVCVIGELERLFGADGWPDVSDEKAILAADPDSDGVDGAEIVDFVEAFLPDHLRADGRVLRVVRMLVWCA